MSGDRRGAPEGAGGAFGGDRLGSALSPGENREGLG